MRQRYNVVRVSKTTARELAREVLQAVGNQKVDQVVLDKVWRSLYNRMRRQANVDKVVG